MKVKLLKKLRKEAKKKFRVRTDDSKSFYIVELKGYSNFSPVYAYKCYCSNFKQAIETLKELRIKYILDYLDSNRKYSTKVIKINRKLSEL